MIEHHNAKLGPAFAIPALEKKFNRKILVVDESGKPMTSFKHCSEKSPITIKFIPQKGDQPAKFCFGDKKFTPNQHGNDVFIHAVLAGVGQPEIDAHEIRKDIAKACTTKDHPSCDYIKSGVAGNLMKMW